MHSFIHRHGQNTGRVEHQQSGMAQTRHKSKSGLIDGELNPEGEANG